MRVVSVVAVALLMIGSLERRPAKAGPEESRPGHLFFKCRRVINPSEGRTIPDAIIEVNGGKILNVGGKGEIPIPLDAKVIDFGEKYIIPGLIDTHGHLYSRTGRELRKTNPLLPAFYLAAGVTAIGNPGSMDFAGDLALRERIDSGQLPGPRYSLAGEYIEMAPKMICWMNPVRTADEARAMVDVAATRGATAIKIYAGAHGDVMQAAIDRAHEHSMRVWAHLGAVTFQRAMDMGVDQLFHGALAMPDGRRSGFTQKDFAQWTYETATLDLADPTIQAMLRTAATRKVVLTPTAVVAEATERGAYERHHMDEQKPFYTREAWRTIEVYLKGPAPAGFSAEVVAQAKNKNLEFIRRARVGGCLLSTGTDYVLLTMLPWDRSESWRQFRS